MELERSTSGGLNKGFSLKFYVGSQVWHGTFEKGRRIYQPKRCEYNNEDEDKSQNILSDKNFLFVFQTLYNVCPFGRVSNKLTVSFVKG